VGLSALPPALLLLGLAVGLTFTFIAFKSQAAALSVFVAMTFFDITAVDPLTKLAGALLGGIWILLVLTRGSRVPVLFRDRPLVGALVLLLAGWIAASSLWADDERLAVVDITRLIQGVVLVMLVYTIVRERRHVHWIIAGYLVGALISAILGLRSSVGRISGGFDDPNELAAVIVPGAVLASFAFVALRGRPVRWLCLALLPVFVLTLVHTDSQGGMVAAVAALLASIVIAGPARLTIWFAVATIAVSAGAFYVARPPSHGQFTEGEGSRLSLWDAALHVARDNPIGGVGAGNFPIAEPAYTLKNISLPRADLVALGYVAHNTYLNILADFGAVGVLLLLALIAAAMVTGLNAARTFGRRGDRELDILARGQLVALVGLLAAYSFQSGQFEKQLWLMIGFAAALDAVAHPERWRGTATAPVTWRSSRARAYAEVAAH
jgi:O-antigen ligase